MSGHTIRYVVYQDRGWWVAQCLEHDLCTSSKKRDDLPRQIRAQLRLRLAVDRKKGRAPFQGLPTAPSKFWKMYEQAKPMGAFELGEPLVTRLWSMLRRRFPTTHAEVCMAAA